MRKRTVRNGMRLVLVALILIVIASFYHGPVSDFLSLSDDAEMHFYQFGIFIAAAIGSYGVVLAVFGLLLSATESDAGIRILPTFLLILGVVYLFFNLLVVSINAPSDPFRERMNPGETITI